MPEDDIIKNTSTPNTKDSLKRDLRALGVEPGAIIIMHSSLSKLGWTVGGSVALIHAVIELITSKGTLIMPCFTGENSEPSKWEAPPVPEEWWETIRENMPAFQMNLSPTRGVGTVAEVFRTFPGVVRSNHPVSSFAAWGKYAKKITQNHNLESDLGEGSPLAKLYELDGQILLVGVTHENNTSLHLAEYRSSYPSKKYVTTGSAMLVNKVRKWVKWEELDLNMDDFEQIGKEFEISINYNLKKVGITEARLFSQRQLIDFAVEWMNQNRS
ncbi:MAG: aminoglycoside N(3)-acetyltransferase [Promethearchaeota archaeon]|jgi:aminoglycoside 3-N-acetyltransferase